MSPSYPNQKTIKTGTTQLIPFPQTGSDTTSVRSLDVPNNPFDNPEYEKHFKSNVESAVLEAWIKVRFLDNEEVDDPFDAIYLAELSSDSIDNRNLDQIIKFTDIEDLSDTVHFDDEWED